MPVRSKKTSSTIALYMVVVQVAHDITLGWGPEDPKDTSA